MVTSAHLRVAALLFLTISAVSASCGGNCCKKRLLGPRGKTGPPGPCVNVTQLPIGSHACPNGGVSLSCPTDPSDSAVVCSGSGGGGGGSGIYSLTRFVDPINGSDSNVGNDITKPAKSIGHVLSLIHDNSALRIYTIFAFDGVYPEALQWKSFINLFGLGQAGTTIGPHAVTSISYNPHEPNAIVQFGNVAIHVLEIDTMAAAGVLVSLTNVQTDTFAYAGLNDTATGQLFLDTSTVTRTFSVTSGYVHARSSSFYGTMDLAQAYVEMVGGRVVGDSTVTVTMTGLVNLLTRGVEWTASVQGAFVGRSLPIWQTDSSSFPFGIDFPDATNSNVQILGQVCVQQEDEKSSLEIYSSDTTLTLETIVYVQPTSVNFTVTLPPASCVSGNSSPSFFDREIIIKRLAGQPRLRVTVAAAGSDLIDGRSTYVLHNPYDFVRVVTSFTITGEWSVIGR